MKFYKPQFSIIVIFVQLILSLKDYYEFSEWGKANPELNGLINRIFLGDNFFLFVLTIGFYEMLTKPSWFKITIRIFLLSIILGAEFSEFIPIDQFYFGVYNTAWFSAVVAFVLILIKIGNYSFKRVSDNRTNRASR